MARICTLSIIPPRYFVLQLKSRSPRSYAFAARNVMRAVRLESYLKFTIVKVTLVSISSCLPLFTCGDSGEDM